MSFPKPIIITSGIALAVILLAVISVALGFIGQPKKYEIADSVDGWVTVTYGNRDCKPLESDGLFVVIRVDASGKGCSSSAMPQGWSYTKFVRVDKSGIQTPLAWGASDSSEIWSWSNRTPQGGSQFFADVFFVGTADKLKSAWSSQPK